MADREPWERQDNPEPWTRPDKAAPWLRKKTDDDPWDRSDDSSGRSAQPESQSSAIQSLRNAEQGAVSRREQDAGNNKGAKSFYTGKGKEKTDKSKASLRGKLKGKGALITIAMILFGGGAFLGASNSLLAPALSALLTASSQTSYTSYILRTKYITKNMLNGTGADVVNPTWTGQVKYSKIPNYMKNRLSQYGIEVSGSGKNTLLHWNGEDIDADRFVTMFNENVEFREAYTRAKRGRVANFFDSAVDKLYQKLGLSRNWRANLKDTGNADTDAKNLHDTLSAKFENDGRTRMSSQTDYTEEKTVLVDEVDENGKPTGNKVWQDTTDVANGNGSDTASGNRTSDMDVATSSATSFLSKVAGTVASVGSTYCTLARIANMIAVTVAANEIYQSINYFMGQMEGPSKMMAGYGNESGINSQLNTMSTSVTSSVPDYEHMQINLNSLNNSNYPDGKVDTVETTAAPLESPILQAVLGGSPIPVSEANNYSLERSLKKIGSAFLFTSTNATVCGAVDIATSVISIASIFAGGIPSFVGNFIAKTVSNVAIQIAMTTVLGFLIPSIAKSLFSNIYDTATGIISSNLLVQGSYAAGSREGRTDSGQGPSSKESAQAFNRATNAVLALEAEQDRYTHSPFDVTNRNTFFGSIAYSLLPAMTSGSTHSIASFLRSTASSLSSIISPNIFAEGDGSSYMTTYGDCPVLDNIDVVGDVFCNPITTTDVSTIELDPMDSTYTDVITESMKEDTCDEDGNGCVIDPESDLAHYISYCDNRDSPFGVVDQNILNELHGPIDNPFLSSIDGVDSLVNAINAINDIKNMDWATGQRCVNTGTSVTAANTDNYKNNSFWEKQGKYYQRYIEDQRILTQMGAYQDSKNPVLAYEEAYEAKYLEDHPEANTYIGYLSRISGLTVENTETMLAFVYYYNYIDEYDPSLRIALGEDVLENNNGEEVIAKALSDRQYFDDNKLVDNNPVEDKIVAREYIIYADVRNRSYTV